MEKLAGQTIKGYELLERIGTGGYGAVYRAYQSTMGREVAVKIVLPGYANQPDFIRRFEAEAQLVARLEHLHIVPLYDYWRSPEGAYLVMRWLRGGSIRDALEEGPFSLEAAALLLDQVASALATAHANGIVHRDLKTSNILLDEEGNAYLADFGIAKDLGQLVSTSPADEQLIGSPSPEQARGEPVTPQTDIYGLGITLYEILTGTQAFPGMNAIERLYKHINDPIPLIETLDPHVRDDINEVVQRATAKNPEHRYGDVFAMAAAFREAAKLGEADRAASLLESLTLREQEILPLIVEGYTNRQIAQDLYIELSTVKWHIRQIYSKLGVRSRKQAVVRARELKLMKEDVPVEHADEVKTGLVSDAALQPVNPYKGLRAFETADSRDFFGREAFLKKILSKLAPNTSLTPSQETHRKGDRFLAIVGPSGSGKSSLVNAGLIPVLREGAIEGSERWFIAEMAPGPRPLDELEVALLRMAADQSGNIRDQLERDRNGLLRAADLILPRDNSELLLVIDQFEELFTLVSDEASRAQFLDILTAAATDIRSRVRVVIIMRADFYDRPLHYPEFGKLIRNHIETVLPLTAEELERAILHPADQAGVTYEQGLVATIIDDVLYQPGALPLLQYALTELFEGRAGRTLTHAAYEIIGGTAGALARRAEELYHEQDSAGQEAIRQMFLRLAALDEESATSPATRQRTFRSELTSVVEDEELVDELIDAYAAYRLLTLDNDTALALAWQAVALNPDSGIAQAQLSVAAYAPGTVRMLTGNKDMVTWSAISPDDKTVFGGADDGSVHLWELATGKLMWEHKVNTKALPPWVQNVAFSPDGQVVAATFDDLIMFWQADTGQLIRRIESDVNRQKITFNPTGDQFATIGAEEHSRLVIWDFASGEVVGEFEHGSNIEDILYTADGSAILIASESGVLTKIDAQTGQVIYEGQEDPETSAGALRYIALSPDGTRVIGAFTEGGLLVWDYATGELLQNYSYYGVTALAFHPQDGTVLIADYSVLRTINLQTGAILHTNTGHNRGILSIAITSDGSRAVTTGVDQTVRVWDLHSGQIVRRFAEANATLWEVALSPDGRTVLSGSTDGTATLWDVETGEEIRRLVDDQPITAVTFSPDGSKALIGGAGYVVLEKVEAGHIILWDVDTGEEIRRFEGQPYAVEAVEFSPDGRTAVSSGHGAMAILWDVGTGEEIRRFEDYWVDSDWSIESYWDVDFSPDGQQIFASHTSGPIIGWDVDSGEQIQQLVGHSTVAAGIEFSNDGQRLISGGSDSQIILWDMQTGNILRRFANHAGGIGQVQFSPDETLLLSGSLNGTNSLWRVETGEEIRRYGGGFVVSPHFAPDGLHAVVGYQDGAVELWRIDATLDELLTWTRNNRYIPELTCEQRELYRVEPFCELESY